MCGCWSWCCAATRCTHQLCVTFAPARLFVVVVTLTLQMVPAPPTRLGVFSFSCRVRPCQLEHNASNSVTRCEEQTAQALAKFSSPTRILSLPLFVFQLLSLSHVARSAQKHLRPLPWLWSERPLKTKRKTRALTSPGGETELFFVL